MTEQPLPIYKSADVRAMDRCAIEDHGLDAYLLMTRAAQASLTVLMQYFSEARSLIILCGAGNNGGDGYVMARLARDRGLTVTVCNISPGVPSTGTAQKAWQDYQSCGGTCTPYNKALLSQHQVIVDAMLGTGLSRELDNNIKIFVNDVNASAIPVMSLDVATGLCSDTGLPMPVAIEASLTMTFVARKIGLFVGRGPVHSGRIVFDSLSIPAIIEKSYTPVAYLMIHSIVKSVLPPRMADTHKGQCGKVLLVGGGKGMPGAMMLSGSAALRVGAGLVKIACHAQNANVIVSQRPEVMIKVVSDGADLNKELNWCDVVAIGPGLGRDEWARRLFQYCSSSHKLLIIDADALHFLAQTKGHSVSDKQAIKAAQPINDEGQFANRARPARKSPMRIITPHVGEAAVLLKVSKEAVQNDRLKACRDLATQYDCIAVLKGAGTVVCSPTSPLYICGDGNPGMATAGTGDVLTGVIAGVWAQQQEPEATALNVALASVIVHAVSGDKAAEQGVRGLIASDVITHLRRVVNTL